MRILVAVHHFPPRYSGGAELRAYRTAKALIAQGTDVRVLCVEHVDEQLGYEDSHYDGVPVRRLSFDLDAAPDPFRWTYDNPWIGERLNEMLDGYEPDLMHLISGYLMSASTLNVASARAIPTVVTLTDFWFLCPRLTLLRSNGQVCAPPFSAATCARCLGEQSRRYRIPGRIVPALMDAYWRARPARLSEIQGRMTLLRDALDRAQAIISPSRFLKEVFVEAGIGAERIRFMRQGRDFPGLGQDVLQKTPSEHLRIGYMGQITPHKGVHTLIEAAGQVSDPGLEVKVYGDPTPFPSYARRLRRLVRHDSRVSLKGAYRRQDVSRVLQGLDVVVVPSLWYENSPNTILEAFAHRTPVIVSDLGGMAELVDDGVNGMRFAAGDAAGLALKLRQLVAQPGLLDRLRTGTGPVKSVAQEMNELVAVYQAVAGNGSNLGEQSR